MKLVEVMGSNDPLPTMIDEGVKDFGEKEDDKLSVSKVKCEEAPESMYQFVVGGGVSVIVLNVFVSDVWSQVPGPDKGVQAGGAGADGGTCGGSE